MPARHHNGIASDRVGAAICHVLSDHLIIILVLNIDCRAVQTDSHVIFRQVKATVIRACCDNIVHVLPLNHTGHQSPYQQPGNGRVSIRKIHIRVATVRPALVFPPMRASRFINQQLRGQIINIQTGKSRKAIVPEVNCRNRIRPNDQRTMKR